MAALEGTHETFDEAPGLESEQFSKGGRDTVVVVWSLIAVATGLFLIAIAAMDDAVTGSSNATPAPAQQAPFSR